MTSLALAAVLALASPAAALANAVDCGDNAFTYAEVVEAKPGMRAKGPIGSVPDSLCADLIEERRHQIDSLHVSVGEPTAAAGAPGAQRSQRRPATGR